MLKIRRPRDRLIFNMGIPILVRRHLYIETTPVSYDDALKRLASDHNQTAWGNEGFVTSQGTHDTIIISLLHQNEVATSFWRNNDVIIASRVHWATDTKPFASQLKSLITKLNIYSIIEGANGGVFFDVRLNNRLSKQCRCRWFETPWRSLWRHGNYLPLLWGDLGAGMDVVDT